MQLSFYYIAARIVKMMLKLGFLFLGRHNFTHPLPLPIRLRRIVKLKTAIQKFVVSDQSKKFQSVIPAPYQIRGKLRQESLDPSLRWDDSDNCLSEFIPYLIWNRKEKGMEKISHSLSINTRSIYFMSSITIDKQFRRRTWKWFT